MDWNFINTSINISKHTDNLLNNALNATQTWAQTYAPWFGGIVGVFSFMFCIIAIGYYMQSGRSMIALFSIAVVISSMFNMIIDSTVLGAFLLFWAIAGMVIVFRAFIKTG